MVQEQHPLPDLPEENEPYRRPVETMSLGQVEHELRDLFGIALLYLLVPIFLLALTTTNYIARPWFLRVLPALAIVFVSYWGLLRAYVPLYQHSPELAVGYTRWIAWLTSGVMSTPPERIEALAARRGELGDESGRG